MRANTVRVCLVLGSGRQTTGGDAGHSMVMGCGWVASATLAEQDQLRAVGVPFKASDGISSTCSRQLWFVSDS
jgi:hypothetical protein